MQQFDIRPAVEDRGEALVHHSGQFRRGAGIYDADFHA